jgi:hypothetical protein
MDGDPVTTPDHVWTGRRATAGDVELRSGAHDGLRVWTPAGPLRPWLAILEPEPGRLVAVRLWRPDLPRRSGLTLYRLTEDVTGDGLPVYELERRRHPRPGRHP